jgi:hydroxyethylthiazole kinase-like uncharacterized protein yjeF
MKIVTAQEMARIEREAYAKGASEEAFMNQAGLGVAEAVRRFIALHHLKPNILLLCGSGNNAGDAYVAGRLLIEDGFQVNALSCAPSGKKSPLCILQSQRFTAAGGNILELHESDSIPFPPAELLLDGLLGTGFHGEIGGILKTVISKANESKLPIIAIDIPSGINGTTGEMGEVVIDAVQTVFLGLPKKGCFTPEAWEHIGRIEIFNFGLKEEFINQAKEDFTLIDDPLIVANLPHIMRTRHKYQAGYVVGLGGSLGMPGAPSMACFAALRSGAGIVRLFFPEEMRGEFTQTPLEVIQEAYRPGDAEGILREMKRAGAFFLGPGLGRSQNAQDLLAKIIPQLDKPCVIDADALFILTERGIAFPQQCILTPHLGEMKMLLQLKEKNIPFSELLERARVFARDHQVTVVLKGAPTYILHCDQKPFICARGDPGMATAGSGDILSGIIAGFLAQTRNPLQAALLGVQFHAMAGELAAEKWTSYCMVATDLIEQLPHIFKYYIKCSTQKVYC